MKKFIVILVLALGVLFANAQTAAFNIPFGATQGKSKSSFTLSNAVAQYTPIPAIQAYPTTQDFIVHLDSLSGNHTNVAVALFGQKSATKGDWTAIGSAVNWKGTTADTTIVISNTTANRYQSFKVTYTGTGTGTTRVYSQELKLWFE